MNLLLPAAARLAGRLYGLVLYPVSFVSSRVDGARERQRLLDRALSVVERYQASHPERIAASVAYYAFLSLVPLVLLASSLLGFVLVNDPETRFELLMHISDVVPGPFAETVVDGVAESRRSLGLIGLFFLLFAGTAWIDSLRAGIRAVWLVGEYDRNVVVKKLVDVLSLFGIGLAFAASVAVSVVGTTASGTILDALSFEDTASRVLLRVSAFLVALASGFVLFLFVFARVPRAHSPWYRLVPAALLAAVGFEVLKLLGALYITWVTRNSQVLGGALVSALAALVWLNLLARLALFAAAWGAPPGLTPERVRAAPEPPVGPQAGSGPAAPPTDAARTPSFPA